MNMIWYEKTSSEASVIEFFAFVSLLYLTLGPKMSPWSRFRGCWKIGDSLILSIVSPPFCKILLIFQIFHILATADNNKNACLSGLVSQFAGLFSSCRLETVFFLGLLQISLPCVLESLFLEQGTEACKFFSKDLWDTNPLVCENQHQKVENVLKRYLFRYTARAGLSYLLEGDSASWSHYGGSCLHLNCQRGDKFEFVTHHFWDCRAALREQALSIPGTCYVQGKDVGTVWGQAAPHTACISKGDFGMHIVAASEFLPLVCPTKDLETTLDFIPKYWISSNFPE